MTGVRIETTDLAGVVIATPQGRLDLASYAPLRDGLLKLASDDPLALVVQLGDDFEVPSTAMMAVFTTVWMRISPWQDVPMVLLAETSLHRDELLSSGVATFVRTADDMKEALAAVERPPHRRFHRVPLPRSPTAPLMARAVVREVCALWDVARLADDAVLVVSELVENAVRHARSESVLRIELRPSALSLAVRDHDPTTPTLMNPGAVVGGHRGVQLVDRICGTWGCVPSSDGGKIVWAVLSLRAGE